VGERDEHTLFEISGHVKWQRVIPRHNKILVIGLHMVGKMSMGLDLESS
jgi:hypothetical protein